MELKHQGPRALLCRYPVIDDWGCDTLIYEDLSFFSDPKNDWHGKRHASRKLLRVHRCQFSCAGWQQFMKMFPDDEPPLRVEIRECILTDGNSVEVGRIESMSAAVRLLCSERPRLDVAFYDTQLGDK